MSQIVTAIYEDGVLKPDQPLALPPSSRVRLTVDTLANGSSGPAAADGRSPEELWTTATVDSGGQKLKARPAP